MLRQNNFSFQEYYETVKFKRKEAVLMKKINERRMKVAEMMMF